MTEIAVATEGLFYCSEECAQEYAVQALLMSKARNINFYEAYYGFLSQRLNDWLDDHIHDLDIRTATTLFSKVRQTEKQRFFLEHEDNNFMKILRDEVIPIGCVIYKIFSGSNKERALAEAQDLLLYSKMDSAVTSELPKSARHLSKRKLERLWAKYLEVPHYVWTISVNSWRLTAGLETVSYRDGRECWGHIMSAFDAVSPTKQISVPEPEFLRFMTSEVFREQLPEIPPRE